MGAAHDKETAKGDDGTLDNPDDYGAYTYSFGYKTSVTTGNFYTIMAYGDSGQTIWRTFSNPNITFCGGRACGTSSEDNTRTLNNTTPVVATFRGTVPGSGALPSPDFYVIKKVGRQGTEVHVLDAGKGYQEFSLHVATALESTGRDGAWKYLLGDYNKDAVLDLYAIKKMGSSGRTEVHVLDGKTHFGTFLLHVATVLARTGTDESWVFDLGDYDHDGTLDLYAVKRKGSSGRTELHVLNGRNRFQSFLLHAATPLPATGGANDWRFAVGDYNRDGALDLYIVKKNGSSGNTELHVLDGAGRFQSYLLHRATVLQATGSDYSWDFKLADFGNDGVIDVYAINRFGNSGSAEINVLNGADGFRSFSTHIATGLVAPGSDGSWDFAFGNY
jgi:hypothetical protein